jgi:hypothetical protein
MNTNAADCFAGKTDNSSTGENSKAGLELSLSITKKMVEIQKSLNHQING